MITLDFETRSCADLKKWGAQRYAHDASTQALCLRWVFDDEDEVGLWHRGHPWIDPAPIPEELIDRIASGEIVEAHNAGFEYYIWNTSLLREFPDFKVKLTLDQLRCSAAKASCVSLPRALGDAVDAVSLEYRKNPRGRFLINKLSKPMPRRKGQQIILFNEDEALHRENWEYCGDDVLAERALSEYCPEMSERELEYWRMDFRMNDRGVYLDLDAARRGVELAESEAGRLNTELRELTGYAVDGFTKRKPLLKWINNSLTALNVAPMPDTKADTFSFALYGVPTKAADTAKEANKPKMDEKWAALGDEGAPVKRVMEIAMEGNKSSVAKYRQMLASVCHDGRLHDIMLYNGADRTGRWSGKGVQPHNFVRGYGAGYRGLAPNGFDEMCDVWHDLKHLDLDLITILWGEPMVALAKACRGALMATPGRVLYAADFNAIEARKLAWLSGCARLLNLFNTPGGDPYIDMASAIYGRPITKADKTERQLGKKAILGLGYAMGWEKFQMTVWMDEGIWLEDEFCMRIVNLYRKKMYPEVPALWKATENAAIAAVREGGEHYCGGNDLGIGSVSYFMDRDFLHCRLPSGRMLAYLYPEVHVRLNYRFKARNARGSATIVTVPVKRRSVPMFRVRSHAEKLALKQNKILLPDSPETFEQPHLSFMGRDMYTRQWKRLGTHGGTLVENYDQASSRDLLAESMLRIDQLDDFDILLSIHDEVVAEGEKDACALGEFEALMAQPPAWAPGMPISAEGWIGERLRK
jgi:DNA polymerase bacteriophage-type